MYRVFLKASISASRSANVIQRVRVQIKKGRSRYNRYYTKLQHTLRVLFFFVFSFLNIFHLFYFLRTSTGLYITIAGKFRKLTLEETTRNDRIFT